MPCRVMVVQGAKFSPVSWLIRRSTGSPFTHCGLVFGDTIYDSDYGGVKSRKLDEYAYPYEILEVKGMSLNKAMRIKTWCIQREGVGYDYGKLVGMYFQVAFEFPFLRKILDKRELFTCYEFVAEALRAGEIFLDEGQETGVPGDLLTDSNIVTVS